MARQGNRERRQDHEEAERVDAGVVGRINDVLSMILIAVCIGILGAGIGYSIGHDTAFNDRCDWKVELFDGERCVDRDDHAAHNP